MLYDPSGNGTRSSSLVSSTNNSTRTVFLAGATGAIGTPLMRLLQRRGYRIVAMTRSASRADALRGERITPIVAEATPQ